MSKYVLTWKTLLAIAFVALIVGSVQTFFADRLAARATVAERVCTVKDYTPRLGLLLDCNGTELIETSTSVVYSHVKNPGPVTCKVARDALDNPWLRGCEKRS